MMKNITKPTFHKFSSHNNYLNRNEVSTYMLFTVNKKSIRINVILPHHSSPSRLQQFLTVHFSPNWWRIPSSHRMHPSTISLSMTFPPIWTSGENPTYPDHPVNIIAQLFLKHKNKIKTATYGTERFISSISLRFIFSCTTF